MYKFALLFIVVFSVWFINKGPETKVVKPVPYTTPESLVHESSIYECDGREYCSQMTSCAEATYFLNNCPNTKMDGNNDGTPCEKQWCGYY